MVLAILCIALVRAGDGEPPAELARGPLTPAQEKKSFRLADGFTIELVAHEPDVIDPVAMTFDERGRIFVAEMHGYPNGGVATGPASSGRIVLLEDRDGDGYYEKSTVFADRLRFPTGLQPWRGGLLVADAPDLLYLEDTRGTGKADRRSTLYTGFDLANIQQLLNSLQWGLDNWVHGCAGGKGGDVRCPDRPEAAVSLHGRGIRFHPEAPGSLEPTSGGGQYGLAPDAWQRWLTATNSQHLRHIVLPDHYLRRNPYLAVTAVTLDIPDHGAACKVHRISPFEAWRVERTTRRAGSPEARHFPATELVPGGYITSACSPVVYEADGFPAAYRGSVFVCDPANNLIHRDVLVPAGATFTARRGEAEREFLASTDNWFRPVHLTLGPDSALYVLDFYREVIETPLSLPADIQKKLNLQSRRRGRIWRIAAKGQPRRKPALHRANTAELVRHLADDNLWWRLTAQRLLVERQDRAAVAGLEQLAGGKSALGRAHALWALHGLKALTDALIEQALKDTEAGVREQALRLADDRLVHSERLRRAVAVLAEDPAPRVRFQLAFTLGQADGPELRAALAKVARKDAGDPWTQTAVLSSCGRCAGGVLQELVKAKDFQRSATPAHLQLLTRLAAVLGARGQDRELAEVLGLLGSQGKEALPWERALLDGLGQGLQNSARSLDQLWERPPPALKEAVSRARAFFEQAARTAGQGDQPLAARIAAVRLLGRGPFAPLAAAAPELLTPQTPPELQLAVIAALSLHGQPAVAPLLLKEWAGYSPAVRREAAEALFARSDRLESLLAALEEKKVLANQLEPARLGQLRRHPDAALRRRAERVLRDAAAPDRRKVIASYRAALEQKGDRQRGKVVFAKTCASCHRLEGVGHEVGPDLLAALRNKSPEQLLTDILDPGREVDPRYLNYVVTTKKGQTYSGLIAAETAASITLRRGEAAEDTLLRGQIDEIQATPQSVMPEGLEAQLKPADVADLIAYLQAVAVAR
jgi:putative membrane-bound dehydrogenase-like protein